MGKEIKSEEFKGKNKTTRYFQKPVKEEHVRNIKVKAKTSKDFQGDVIQVDQTKEKPLKYNIKKKKFTGLAKLKIKKEKIPKEVLAKYSRGEKIDAAGVKTEFFKEKQERKEVYLQYATEQAARTELLLPEEGGFIEPGEEEITAEYRQDEIVKNVDLQSAAKYFKLNLDFGPYSMRFTKNGRHLLLGGRRGHVCAFDWITKKLLCEMNVMEEVADVSWLHIHTMFACAQKNWVHIYDNKGTELHCVKTLNKVNRMEFLPYHFLLATCNNAGYASWLDVSIGEIVGNYNTRLGDIRLMCNNPANGVVCFGGGKGVVSMWSPKVKKPLATMLCHRAPISALTIDPKGLHMVTAGHEKKIKVWDVRSLDGPLATYDLKLPANQLQVSQKGVLAFAQGAYCEMYRNLMIGSYKQTPYLRQHCGSFISGMRFCPYEDVLGISTANGFQTMLVPGSGEPNFDALEDNPYQTKKQRREHEVHLLLEKIPPELITLDPNEIAAVDEPTLQEKVDAKRALFFVKPPQIDFQSRRKMKGKGGGVKAANNKQIVKDQIRKEFINEVKQAKQEILKESGILGEENKPKAEEDSKPSVLDRFKPKKKKKVL